MRGLCLFCLKHAAELECYGGGVLSKPRCTQAGCDGEHTPSAHRLIAGGSVAVNLVAEDESESGEDEDEEWWVGTIEAAAARDEGEGEPGEEGDHGWESGSEHAPATHLSEKLGKSGRCSPELPDFSSGEDEEEARHPMDTPSPRVHGVGAATGSEASDLRGLTTASSSPREEMPPCPKGTKRRRPRRKVKRGEDQEWERARRDAWLRGMLSDMSSDEDEDKYERFVESGRWFSELFGTPSC
jgi:hypothetical protein